MALHKGQDINCRQDIQKLVSFYCKISDYYTINDIYDRVQIDLTGSRFVVKKKLYKMIEATTTKLIEKGVLLEQDGVFYHEKIKLIKVEHTPELSM